MQYTIPNSDITINVIDDFNPPDYNDENARPTDELELGLRIKDTSFSVINISISNQHMPYFDPTIVIDSIHSDLNDKQGLIEVRSGWAKNGPYLYSIVKNQIEPCGMMYILSMDMSINEATIHVQGQFMEEGTTGQRDALVLSAMKNNESFDMEKHWFRDHYDPNYTKGLRMNISENEYWDARFPEHPLSVCRYFIDRFVHEN